MINIEKARACPNCDQSVGWLRFWLKPWIWAEWPCENCGAPLGFDKQRRFKLGFVSALFMAPGIALLLQGVYWPALICIPIWIWIWSYDSVQSRHTSE